MAGFSFGTGTNSGFNFSTPTSTAATTSAPSNASSGFSFLAPSSVGTSTPSTSANTLGGFKFSGFSSTPTTSTAVSTGPTLNFNLGSSSTNTTTGGGGTGLSLFNINASSSASSNLGSSNLNFAKLPVSSTSSVASSGVTTSTPTLNFASSNPSTTAVSVSSTQPTFGPVASLTTATTTSSFGSSGAGGATNVSMRQLEERLNKWLVELKEQEERFIRQAAHVNAWDQILQNGHDQVQSLKDTLHTVKSDQSRLEAEIDFIRGQQEELERLLEPLESATNVNPATQLHQGDRQRDNMYYLAQSLDAQLRQMTDDLGKVIEHLNTSSGPWQPNDPVTLVARILSAHMDTLKWVDRNTVLLSQKIEEVSRVAANAGKRG